MTRLRLRLRFGSELGFGFGFAPTGSTRVLSPAELCAARACAYLRAHDKLPRARQTSARGREPPTDRRDSA